MFEKTDYRWLVIFLGLVALTPLMYSGLTAYSGIFDHNMWFISVAFMAGGLSILYALFFLKESPKISFTLLDIVFISWLTWLVITTLFTSSNIIDSFFGELQRSEALLHWLALGVYYFWLRLLMPIAKEKLWRTLQALFMISGASVSIYGLLAYFMNMTENHDFYGTFNNQNFVAYFLSLTVITTYVWWLESNERDTASRWGLMALLLQAVALWLTQARWVYAITFGGLIIAYWLTARNGKLPLESNKKRWSLWGFVGVIGVILTSFLTHGNAYILSLGLGTFQHRLAGWQISIEAWLAKPIFGWGLENFNDAFNVHYQPLFEDGGSSVDLWFDRAHNFVLQYLVTVGLVGLIIFLILTGIALWVGIKRIYRQENLAPWAVTVMLVYLGNKILGFGSLPTTIIFVSTLAYLSQLMPAIQDVKSNKFLINGQTTFSVAMIFFGLAFGALPWLAHQRAAVHIETSNLRAEKDFDVLDKILARTPYFTPQIMMYAQTIKNLADPVSYRLLAQHMLDNPGQFKNNPEFHAVTATAWDMSNDPLGKEKVKNALSRALELSPQNASLWMSLAITEANLGDFEAALKNINMALKLNPETLGAGSIKTKILTFLNQEEV